MKCLINPGGNSGNDMKFKLLLCSLLLSCICHGQTRSSTREQVLKELLEKSAVIDGEYYDLEFVLNILPDNHWYLKFKKDSTYEYIHWSGWGEAEGTILEYGKYSIRKNKIKLMTTKKDEDLIGRKFYLFSLNENFEERIFADCVESGSMHYCLYIIK